MAHPYYQPKVIGKITLPDAPKKHECVCDYCQNVVDDSWGDPRTKITRTYSDGKVEIKYICANCEFDEYGDNYNEPRSIFDGTPDWMRMGY